MSESSTAERRTMVAELTDDMTVTDLLDTHTLKHLRFPGGQPSTVRASIAACAITWCGC